MVFCRLYGRVADLPVEFLYDTGASCTVVGTGVWERIPPWNRPPLDNAYLSLRTAGKHGLRVIGRARVPLTIEGHTITWEVYVCDEVEGAILGADFLAAHHLQWDWVNDRVWWPEECPQDDASGEGAPPRPLNWTTPLHSLMRMSLRRRRTFPQRCLGKCGGDPT